MHSIRIVTALALIVTACAPPAGQSVPGLRPGHPASATVARHRPNAPVLVRKKNGRYRVAEPWTVALDGKLWQVQKGYTCNGITGPNQVRRTLGDGIHEPETWAAVFHDWLFTQPGISRETADRLFYQLLVAYGVSPLKSRLMYSSVSAYSASKALR
jgi:hypothetical protein